MSQNDFKADRRQQEGRDNPSDRRQFLRPTGDLRKKGLLIALVIFLLLCLFFVLK